MRKLVYLMAVLALCLLTALPSHAAGAELTILSPMNGEQVLGDSIRVVFQVTGMQLMPSTIPLAEAGKHPEANKPDEGHLHFMLDLQPPVVWGSADPYTFNNVPAGEHQLSVELVNNDHSSLTPPMIRQLRVTVAGAQGSPAPNVVMLPNTGATDLNTTLIRYILLTFAAVVFFTSGLALRDVARRRAE